MTLFNSYLCIAIFLINPVDTNIDILFYNWNKATLNSIKDGIEHANNPYEKKFYESNFEGKPIMWNIEYNSFNKESIRWKFLEKIQQDFNWKHSKWTIIEVRKEGERVRFVNNLICYNSSGAKIITYEWFFDKWKKIEERHAVLKMADLSLRKARVPFNSGKYDYDIIVTNFKSESILESVYFINTTLSDKGKIADIIN